MKKVVVKSLVVSVMLGFLATVEITLDGVISTAFGIIFWLSVIGISIPIFVLTILIFNYLDCGKFRFFLRSNSPNQR